MNVIQGAAAAPPSLCTRDPEREPSLLVSFAYGAGILGFLYAPFLLLGTRPDLAVLDAAGVLLAVYLLLITAGLVQALRRGRIRRQRVARRQRRL